jgi:hypothetical protein
VDMILLATWDGIKRKVVDLETKDAFQLLVKVFIISTWICSFFVSSNLKNQQPCLG